MKDILGTIANNIRRFWDTSYGLSEESLADQAAIQAHIEEPVAPVKRGPGRPRKNTPKA